MTAVPASLHTARLRLRRPRPSDADTIFAAYAGDADVCRFLIWRPHGSVAETREFIALCVSAWDGCSHFPYVITARDADAAIGMIHVRVVRNGAELGYVLARSHWGKGLMVEAICAVTDAALAGAEIHRVQACCDVDNKQSQRVLEKAGFRCEGRLERHSVHPNMAPEPRDRFMYARCR